MAWRLESESKIMHRLLSESRQRAIKKHYTAVRAHS